ncbi:MAG TPA: NAD-dependent succinate-semialdehyde dehydrogenase [Candidatus Limnocylindrales bacterium]|nr:NAD-dependent succinate-semialdehyde dehydrogenase [Candidatus Limnocylindrales bacterium]
MAVRAPTIESVNPATEEVLARYDAFTADQVEDALAEAHDAFGAWRERPIAERARPMRALANLLRERADRYARLLTSEMGKPIAEALAEIEKCAWTCDHYAENAGRYLADERVPTNARESYVAFEPLGVVLAVMPWNYPFWQVVRFAAPALMAGNAAVLKHASNVPQCALAVEEAVRDAGFPAGLLRAVLVPGRAVEPLIADERVRAVTLTGSSDTGSRIAELAGRALKKAVLELGGSDAFMVLADADLDAAARTGARARYQNAGQSCIAAKRFLVAEPVAAEFERRFAEAIRSLRVGDPLDPETQVGPLARADLRDALERQVERSVALGARVVLGGKRRPGRGWYFEPTLLADVTPEMPVVDEETFGPVAALFTVRDGEEAVRVANASPYGLGASLWTRDLAAAKALARRVEAGSVFVNGMVASDPRLPFGGVKRSGFGRELSAFGIREFVNIQTVWIGPADERASPSAPSE